MADKQEADKYIRCSTCKCKYINDHDHIKDDFEYNRLNERFKCCVKCRWKKIQYKPPPDVAARMKQYNAEKFTCSTCGTIRGRSFMRAHEKQNGCARNDVKRFNTEA